MNDIVKEYVEAVYKLWLNEVNVDATFSEVKTALERQSKVVELAGGAT